MIRYQAHPSEVLAKAPTATRDIVLLSMGGSGAFESDPDVGWQDDGQGTVTFTLTQGLFEAMIEGEHVSGYRCLPHLFSTRGDFAVSGAFSAGFFTPGR